MDDSLARVGVLVFCRQTSDEVAAISVKRIGCGTSYTVCGSRYTGWRARVARRRWRTTAWWRRVTTARRHWAQPFRLHVGCGRHFVVVIVGVCRIVINWMLDLHTDPRTSALRQTKQIDVSFDVHWIKNKQRIVFIKIPKKKRNKKNKYSVKYCMSKTKGIQVLVIHCYRYKFCKKFDFD